MMCRVYPSSSALSLMVVFILLSCALASPRVARHLQHSYSTRLATSLRDLDLHQEPPLSFREKLFNAVSFKSLSTKAPQELHYTQPVPVTKRLVNKLRQLVQLKGGSNAKKKLLILMSDTGGGHRASAQALDQALKEQYPGRIDVSIMDIWTDHAKWPFNKFVPVYRYLAKHPLLWRGFYAYGLFPPTKLFTELDSQRACYGNFKRAIEAADPDFVVSVHPLCQLMPISIVREMNRKRVGIKPRIPFVTVVTDLGSAHTCWFDRRADAVYVPSEAVRDIALRNYIPANKILMKGLPIRPRFWRPAAPKAIVRRALGLTQDAKTVLLMGGGDGVGGLGNIATEIASKLRGLDLRTQLMVICGHNQKVREQLTQKLVTAPARSANGVDIGRKLQAFAPLRLLSRLQRKESAESTSVSSAGRPARSPVGAIGARNGKLSVNVQGFVNNIDEWMGASDLLVTKAGPGTIAEAMTRGLPLVLSSYLPGQEYGNVPYVTEGGFGVYTGNSPQRIAAQVCELVRDDAKLRRMSERARKLSRPEATREIAADIASVLLHPPRRMKG